ncbi:MAG TPA: hypothetical protein VK129_00675, partial [Terriglobales bacterium]|nr:hypothetical protein [Terriglobales bacterium]
MTNRIRAIFLMPAVLCAMVFLRPLMVYGEELEDHGQKTFNVHAGGTLTFASEYGTVTVKAGDVQ